MNKIKITESELNSLIISIINEVRGESTSQKAIDFLVYARRKLEKLYGKGKRSLIADKLQPYIDMIEKHDLQTVRGLFNDKYSPSSNTNKTVEGEIDSKPNINTFFNRPKDWVGMQNKEFDAYYNNLRKQSNKLDEF